MSEPLSLWDVMQKIEDELAAQEEAARPRSRSETLRVTVTPEGAPIPDELSPVTPTYTYYDSERRIWNPKAGVFETKPAAWWDRLKVSPMAQAQAGGFVLVDDFNGPTVKTNPNGTVFVQRGCILCGHKLIAQRLRSFAGFRGGLCIACTVELDRRPHHSEAGLVVSIRLSDEGWTGDWRPLRRVKVKGTDSAIDFEEYRVRGWRRLLWADRVLKAESPEIQQPPSRPFGYLAAPIRVDEVSA